MQRLIRRQAVLWLVVFSLAGCSVLPSVQERIALVQNTMTLNAWLSESAQAHGLPILLAYPADLTHAKTLTVFIEGDGLSWVSRSMPSSNPTPIRPVALEIALAHPEADRVYLGRPCQYVWSVSCGVQDWTSGRFSPAVLEAYQAVLDELKVRWGVQEFRLVGYSGGAQIAIFLAASRTDVREVAGVAGNLDHQAWTEFHRISPLSDSLPSREMAQALNGVRQTYWFGQKDEIVRAEMFGGFLKDAQRKAPVKVFQQPDFDHGCCWVQAWPGLWLAR